MHAHDAKPSRRYDHAKLVGKRADLWRFGETLNEAITKVPAKLAGSSSYLTLRGDFRVGGYVAANRGAFIERTSSSLGLEARHAGDRHVVQSRAVQGRQGRDAEAALN
ncbi:MAG: hypothetical protein DCF16_18505 [Alphaproteobacteria bacterium]|nr:MAG: hypothetical protein DCF16_18505 [Alphaproteobacteria bacterium]